MRRISRDCRSLKGVICLGWIEMLSRTYDACSSLAGIEMDGGLMLLPLSHSTANAQIELTVDRNGELVRELTSTVEKNGRDEVTIIPVTEDSAARSNGNFPHPLCDKLCYVAGDYSRYTGEEKEEYFEAYLKGLQAWTCSQYGNSWLRAVYSYVERGTMISDLASIGLLKLDEAGKLSEKDNKMGQISQTDAFVRFAVVENGHKIDLWKKQEMFEAYKNYYLMHTDEKELCYVSGSREVCTEKHPSKIRNTADKAKMISGNDDAGFTYKGRFSDKKEAVSVGYETSQKAHNALRWLLRKQGYLEDGNAVVVWKLPGEKKEQAETLAELEVPDIFGDSLRAFSISLDEEAKKDEEKTREEVLEIHTGERYAMRLKQAMQGYARDLKPDDKVIMLAVDAATTGRLSINYYHEFAGNEFIDRVIEWHEHCAWQRRVRPKNAEKSVLVRNAPSPKEIVLAAFGTQRGNGYLDCDPELMKSTIQRILPCIVGLNPRIPKDIVRAAVSRASNPQAYSSFVWENQVMAVACAMLNFNQYKIEKERDEGMELEKEREKERAELFGRLLAIMDAIERKATYSSEQENSSKRLTNAKKLWNVYTRRPMTTFERLNQKMIQAYVGRLTAGTRSFMEDEVVKLVNRLNEIDGYTNKPLREEYLLGYCAQRDAMKWNKEENENEENENEENVEGGNE